MAFVVFYPPTRGKNMIDVAFGEFLAFAHRTRRYWILGTPVAMAAGTGIMVARNWHAIVHLFTMMTAWS